MNKSTRTGPPLIVPIFLLASLLAVTLFLRSRRLKLEVEFELEPPLRTGSTVEDSEEAG